ncbi:hypothetical protein [Cohnella algarum]|uniref:hypothetical protein n=1 Tax=Cohnella algarum TaxID=2044859 RepID=UPI0019681D8B|nr:hypothetical protein [Cohnella algarum]MBN2982648.1 hypothetical protein [Cohnella algarum]
MFRPGFNVFDIHGHLPYNYPKLYDQHEKITRYASERSERMRLTWDLPSEEADDAQASRPLVERWKDELDRYGIGGLNFLTGWSNEELAVQIAAIFGNNARKLLRLEPSIPQSETESKEIVRS